MQIAGDLARLIPFDQVAGEEHRTFCTPDYITHPRELSVKLPRVGFGRLRVVGRRASSYAPVLDSVEMLITLRP